MTGYTVHTGASKKFVNGWDRIFSGEGTKKKDGGKATKAQKTGGKKNKKS
jgi:hypothetical protein